MRVYGELFKAQLENLASSPGAALAGRAWYRTDISGGAVQVSTGTLVKSFLLNDQLITIGTSGTAANNARLYRSGAGQLALVIGSDATAEGTLAPANLAQLACVLPTDTLANLTAYARKAGVFYYGSDTLRTYFDNGTSLNILQVPKSPTVQVLLATGVTTGYLFTISTSSTVAVGDTYTNNGHTYTVLTALTATSGQVLYCSGALAPTATGNLTRATGAGTATIAYTLATALATYTPPAGVQYIKVRMVGGGGGGGGSGTASWGAGADGKTTTFGTGLLVARGGIGSIVPSGGLSVGGDGGTGTVTAPAIGIGLQGGWGGGGGVCSSSISQPSGVGGCTPFGGAGVGVNNGGAGISAKTNTGSGGGGGPGIAVNSLVSGGGGGAGGYVDAIIPSPSASYYCVATGAVGGTSGTSGGTGGTGAEGLIIVEEHYQ